MHQLSRCDPAHCNSSPRNRNSAIIYPLSTFVELLSKTVLQHSAEQLKERDVFKNVQSLDGIIFPSSFISSSVTQKDETCFSEECSFCVCRDEDSGLSLGLESHLSRNICDFRLESDSRFGTGVQSLSFLCCGASTKRGCLENWTSFQLLPVWPDHLACGHRCKHTWTGESLGHVKVNLCTYGR